MGSYFLDVALSKRGKQQSSRSRRGEKRSRVTRRATRRATMSVTRSKGGGGGVMSQHDSSPARSPRSSLDEKSAEVNEGVCDGERCE